MKTQQVKTEHPAASINATKVKPKSKNSDAEVRLLQIESSVT